MGLSLTGVIGICQSTETENIRKKYEAGLEYLTPRDRHDRNIRTISMNTLYGWERFEKTPFTFVVGITSTYAWGTITQFDENLDEITFSNNAFGIGPVYLLRFEPFIYRGLSLAPEFMGGIILYSKEFPAGGDIYNFMWRLGGSINYRVNKNYSININTKWMHVSNGQGVGPGNPSYEALGFGIAVVKYLQR